MSDSELEQLEQWLDEAGTRMIDGDWSLWQDNRLGDRLFLPHGRLALPGTLDHTANDRDGS